MEPTSEIISAHGWTLQVLPALGASIGGLRHDGRDILRPAPAQVRSILETGCFPLVPYANRIAHGAFEFRGRSYRLPRNFEDHPHSLHGHGWQRVWQLFDRTAASLSLRLDHQGDRGWPWRYRAEQRFDLTPGRARIELSIQNADIEPMPVGLGLHPYFPVDETTMVRFTTKKVWLTDDSILPTNEAPAAHFGDWSAGFRPSEAAMIDNAYEGWDGCAQLSSCELAVELTAEGIDALHVYHPTGADFICLEPVTHLPDAVNRGGMDSLQPGEARSIALTITICGN